MEMGESIRRLLVAIERLDVATRRSLGLSANEALVLSFAAEGVRYPAHIAGTIGMTTAGMTNLLDRLERDGYLRRQRHPDDARRIQLLLTKRGLRAHQQLQSAHDELAELAGNLERDASRHVADFVRAAADLLDARAMKTEEVVKRSDR